MAVANLTHNATHLDLVGNLAFAPLADRTARALGSLTGEFEDLADLLIADANWCARTWRIGEAVKKREFVETDGVKGEPASSPEAGHIEADVEFTRDLRRVQPISSSEHDTDAKRDLLWSGMAADEVLQGGACRVREHNGFRLST